MPRSLYKDPAAFAMEAGTIIAVVELGLRAIRQTVRIYNWASTDESSKSRIWQLHDAVQTFMEQLDQAREEVEDIESKARFLKAAADTIRDCTRFLDRYDPQGNGPNLLERGILTIDDTPLCVLHERIGRHQTQLSLFLLLELNRELRRRQSIPTPDHPIQPPNPDRQDSSSSSSLRTNYPGSQRTESVASSVASSGGTGCVTLSLKYYKESWDFPVSLAHSYYSSDAASLCVKFFHPDLVFTFIHEVPLNESGIPTSRLSHGKPCELGFLPINSTHVFRIIVNDQETRLTDIPTYKVRKGVDRFQIQSLLRGRTLLGSYRVTDVEVGRAEGGEGEVKIWENPSDPRHPTVSFPYRPKREFVHREFALGCFDAEAELHVRSCRLTLRKWGHKKGFSLSRTGSLYEGSGKPGLSRNAVTPDSVAFQFEAEDARKEFLKISAKAHKHGRYNTATSRAHSMVSTSTQATLVNETISEASAPEYTTQRAARLEVAPNTSFDTAIWNPETATAVPSPGLVCAEPGPEIEHTDILALQYATMGYPQFDAGSGGAIATQGYSSGYYP
ncbi:hypothetical protein MKZ38_002597 [Zalerion maritima]|uniref:Uncharacterized protein n=1 Tax=Zalerion maritima TaxID=339359 RepID=A0AAD5RQ91_9PEZI|nr:hypothetical protein MKZ38_002597 [Zalerion maritima]